jgi:hypothetical protein
MLSRCLTGMSGMSCLMLIFTMLCFNYCCQCELFLGLDIHPPVIIATIGIAVLDKEVQE